MRKQPSTECFSGNRNLIPAAIVTWFAVATFVVPFAAAQPSSLGGISGRVSTESGKYLEGATIELQAGATTAVTNRLGDFEFSQLKPGAYTVTAS